MLGRRTTRYGFNTAVMVLLVLGVIGFVEALSYRHNSRFDLTENSGNSLSPQTIQLLKGLKTDVNAVAFFRTTSPASAWPRTCSSSTGATPAASSPGRVVDPDREPELARRYGVESYGTIVLETKERSEKVTDADEEKLTNGLVKLTREGKRVVYVVQGHGEHELTNTERPGFSEAKTAMERANYEVKPLVLARDGKIPEDASVIVLPGPRTDLLAARAGRPRHLRRQGRQALAMADPVILAAHRDPLKALLQQYGFTLGDNLIVEPNPIGRLFGIGPEVPIVQQYEPHPITRDMAGITTLFPLTRSVARGQDAARGDERAAARQDQPPELGARPIRDALQQGEAKPDPGTRAGPLPVAAVATKDKARIVVYGTSNLAANQFINLQGNRDFFLNTVSWLAEEEDQISIRPKDDPQTPVFLTSQQAQAVFLLPVVVLPGAGPRRRHRRRGPAALGEVGRSCAGRPLRPRRVLLVASAGFYYVYEVRLAPDREKAETRKGRVFTAEPKDVTELTLKRPGESIGSSARATPGRWSAPVKARADRGPVEEVVTTVADRKIDREIVATPTSLADFGLDKPAAEVTLTLKDGKQLGLALGGKNPTGVWVYARSATSRRVRPRRQRAPRRDAARGRLPRQDGPRVRPAAR